MTNVCLAQIKRIKSTCTNQELDEKAMKRGMNNMIRKIKSRSIFDMMERLIKSGIGMNDVMCLSEKICDKPRSSRKPTLVDTGMK